METKKLTAAESTLAAMSKTVLVLGIIGSIVVFFSSCIAWEYSRYSGGIVGADGINCPYLLCHGYLDWMVCACYSR